jgi:hypothetical protein
MSQSLLHEYAEKFARASIGIIAPCLREEEIKEAYGLFYEAAILALNEYESRAERQHQRLKPIPSKN